MFYLKKNLPGLERWGRIALALGLGIATATSTISETGMWIAYAISVTLAGTALVGFCPACALVGRQPLKGRNDSRI